MSPSGPARSPEPASRGTTWPISGRSVPSLLKLLSNYVCGQLRERWSGRPAPTAEQGGYAPAMEASIPAVLRERASLQPNDTAFTYLDYERDPAGFAESLTWSQLYRRSLNVAHELSLHGSPEDRAVILASQGLDYVAAFLGALQAGFYAVPLPVPQPGAHDDRVSSVLEDTSPSVILTTSADLANVIEYAQPQNGGPAPAIVQVDLLDLDARRRASVRRWPTIAYLQYTSGSTRAPAGVV